MAKGTTSKRTRSKLPGQPARKRGFDTPGQRPAERRSRAAPALLGRAARATQDPVRPQTKQALIVGLLQRPDGATVADLVAATGWLRHTTRAALTRLRQAGHRVAKEKRATGETAYRITAAEGASARGAGR